MILAGTGHRPDKLGGYTEQAATSLRQFLRKELARMNPKCCISGMALGYDQALAWACVDLEIPFVAAIPFKGQEALWPHHAQLQYRELLAKAVGQHYICDPGYAAWKMQKRNCWMVHQLKNKEDRVLALWNKSEGGTGNCVRYAKEQGVGVLNLWDSWVWWNRRPLLHDA